jgi:hypothetical protein
VRGAGRHRGHHRGSRCRQDRRHPGRDLGLGSGAARDPLPAEPLGRSAGPNFYTATLAPQAADALAAEHAEHGRTPVVVIDEAHLLDNAQMEAIRMLTLSRAPVLGAAV